MKTKSSQQLQYGYHGHVSILHDESENLAAYEGVEARIRMLNKGKDFKKVFNSGDVPSDFIAAVTYLMMNKKIQHISMSSSCDHFPCDIKPRRFGWYTHDILGEFLKHIGDENRWHKVTRLHGKNKGREMWVQGPVKKEESGHFIVLDNASGIIIMSPNEPLEYDRFETVKDAMDFCDNV